VIQVSFVGSISGWTENTTTSVNTNNNTTTYTYTYTAPLTVTQMNPGSDTIKQGQTLSDTSGILEMANIWGASVSAFGSGSGGAGTYTMSYSIVTEAYPNPRLPRTPQPTRRALPPRRSTRARP
jgi:hypothetical protein